ncbi:Hsp70 family protein [Donghicola sp. C2-DW-16]|uniref:Hsp70 family protein n=1 Tax=Donghicola mangrovi TaxID=2729614 RepID=A0ABX2PIE8_9RHOB|nr:Hsp70 family protein [Donghicola mangrovi]NVO28859.1 Hsp70 family protein [Donghicola mangrovi]
MAQIRLGIDFGTSNSAAALYDGRSVQRIALEDGADTIPTAVFFPTDKSGMLVGGAASTALIDGEEGRYMRALKSVLGDPLFHESRLIGGKRQTIAEVVTAFLIRVRTRAEQQTGETCTSVLSGRPVHFHSEAPDMDSRALDDLRSCYEAAGFTDIAFMNEPEAAAHAYGNTKSIDGLGLIVDIGGGTSDFSIFQATGQKVNVLASHGVRLGGTDFDHAISMAHAMPLLGHGGQLRRTFGEGLLPAPVSIYADLATWAKIPFVYSRDTEKLVADMLRHAVDPDRMERLQTVVTEQLGHELAFAVERGKIDANSATPDAAIRMGFIERGLNAPLTKGSMTAALGPQREKLRNALYQTFMMAQIMPNEISSIVLVGGSSLMTLVEEEARAVCPMASVQRSEAFTAVVDGLAIAAASAGD